MRHIFAFGISAVGLMLCSPVLASAQIKPAEVPKEAHDEAERSLPALRRTITPETYERLGFKSVEEANRAVLELPMRVYMVRLDRLREYRPQANVSAMLEDTHEVQYAVSVDGNVRASVTMRQIEGKWQVVRFGRPALTQALTEAVHKQMATTRTPAEAFFEVKIPALNLYFVARQEGERLMLTSVTDDDRFDLRRGEAVDAQQLFSRIAPYARKLKAGPYLSD